jgi:hypothetical protein
MEQKELRQIPLVALFAALAIIFPQFFHFLGLGSVFLPMFIPIMVGSMFLTWRFVILLAILSPTVSWLITGMPPIAPPILPLLILELAVVGLFFHSNGCRGISRRNSSIIDCSFYRLLDREKISPVEAG